MKTSTIIILAWVAIFAMMGFITLKALEHEHKTVEVYVPYHDTVLIDRSRERKITDHDYQLELDTDSIYLYDGQRLLAVLDSLEKIPAIINQHEE